MTEALSKLFLGKSSAAENAHLTASLTLRKQRQPVALAANGLETVGSYSIARMKHF